MAGRTFIPTLVRIVWRLCLYITKYGKTIKATLTVEQGLLFDALHAACTAFLEGVDPPPVEP